MGNDERWPGQSWGAPEPLETRWDALTTLHPETPGMDRWVKDGGGRGYWADCCDKHRPAEIIEARRAEQKRREEAERALAEYRHRPYHPPPEEAPDVTTSTVDVTPAPPSRFGFLRRKAP